MFTKINQKGFTLIEIMTLVLILGIMVGVALPNYNFIIFKYRTYLAAKEMAANIRLLQQKAIAEESSDYIIEFGIKDYSLKKANFDNREFTIIKVVKLEKGVAIAYNNFDNFIINIDASGKTRNGHICLKSSLGHRYYVIIAITGRVRVDNKPPD